MKLQEISKCMVKVVFIFAYQYIFALKSYKVSIKNLMLPIATKLDYRQQKDYICKHNYSTS